MDGILGMMPLLSYWPRSFVVEVGLEALVWREQ